MKANLQDAEQMKAFMAQFKEEYGRDNGEGQGMGENEKHSNRKRHLLATSGVHK